MSKLLNTLSTSSTELYDLSRTKSFRVETKPQRIFRPSDLVQGELLGKGFFGKCFNYQICYLNVVIKTNAPY